MPSPTLLLVFWPQVLRLWARPASGGEPTLLAEVGWPSGSSAGLATARREALGRLRRAAPAWARRRPVWLVPGLDESWVERAPTAAAAVADAAAPVWPLGGAWAGARLHLRPAMADWAVLAAEAGWRPLGFWPEAALLAHLDPTWAAWADPGGEVVLLAGPGGWLRQLLVPPGREAAPMVEAALRQWAVGQGEAVPPLPPVQPLAEGPVLARAALPQPLPAAARAWLPPVLHRWARARQIAQGAAALGAGALLLGLFARATTALFSPSPPAAAAPAGAVVSPEAFVGWWPEPVARHRLVWREATGPAPYIVTLWAPSLTEAPAPTERLAALRAELPPGWRVLAEEPAPDEPSLTVRWTIAPHAPTPSPTPEVRP